MRVQTVNKVLLFFLWVENYLGSRGRVQAAAKAFAVCDIHWTGPVHQYQTVPDYGKEKASLEMQKKRPKSKGPGWIPLTMC